MALFSGYVWMCVCGRVILSRHCSVDVCVSGRATLPRAVQWMRACVCVCVSVYMYVCMNVQC